MGTTQMLERQLGDWLRPYLPRPLAELVMFGLKMGWATLFGALLLLAILLSKAIWQETWPVARYDALVIFAVIAQILFLKFRLESFDEVKVIFLFHLSGTAMEIFKIHAGSWAYPEIGYLKIMGVPLFSGFMYASVGSFMARSIRLFDMKFAPFPPTWGIYVFGALIYVNFFSHHYMYDFRYVLFGLSLVLFLRTRIWFQIGANYYWMPLPLAAFFTSFFLWVAENIGTLTGTWLYNGQTIVERVSFAKLGSWYLLLFVSFATVFIVIKDATFRAHMRPNERP